jgi:glyoxylase-like metal-dependent hydrolase (beta-lactamase superfamily II)
MITMALQIIPFYSGINTFYLIREEGMVLFDAGVSKDVPRFPEQLKQHGIPPEEIRLIILSHGDFDHAGGAKGLKEVTGAKIVIHENDRKILEEALFHWPKGVTAWGKISRATLKPLLKKTFRSPGVKADIVLDDNDFSLEPYGIHGRVVYTPGHTYGSVSLLLDSGDALIGCLAHNRLPFVLKPKLPIYALDIELIKKSWGKVIEMGAKICYPGHGKPFPLEKIMKYLNE